MAFGFRRGSGDRKQAYRTAHENQGETLANACCFHICPFPIMLMRPKGKHRGYLIVD